MINNTISELINNIIDNLVSNNNSKLTTKELHDKTLEFNSKKNLLKFFELKEQLKAKYENIENIKNNKELYQKARTLINNANNAVDIESQNFLQQIIMQLARLQTNNIIINENFDPETIKKEIKQLDN